LRRIASAKGGRARARRRGQSGTAYAERPGLMSKVDEAIRPRPCGRALGAVGGKKNLGGGDGKKRPLTQERGAIRKSIKARKFGSAEKVPADAVEPRRSGADDRSPRFQGMRPLKFQKGNSLAIFGISCPRRSETAEKAGES